MKWIDVPPVWLLGFLVIAWWIGDADPLRLSFGGVWAQFAGGVLIGAGVVLMLLAVAEMRKWRTTVVPHRDADHLVTSGIFRRSRNPIYLGDALILAGFIMRWDAVAALPLVPVFVWVLERRFGLPEEDRLRRRFRQDFHRYSQKTRRWI